LGEADPAGQELTRSLVALIRPPLRKTISRAYAVSGWMGCQSLPVSDAAPAGALRPPAYPRANLRILAQTFVDDLAQQIVIGPGQELDLGHQLGPHPMHAAEDQG
jgi:hypothetical protein